MQGTTFFSGVLLIILGGIMEGSFTLPLKFTRRWEWENIWGAGSLMALLLVPWPLVVATIKDPAAVYSAAPMSSLIAALLFGAGWGVGGIFFGLGINALGISLGLSLIMGLIAIGGSIIPLIMEHPEQLLRPPGLVLTLGIILMILGISICAVAGGMKTPPSDNPNPVGEEKVFARPSFKIGLFYCIAAGLLSALVNFGLIYGGGIAEAAIRQGSDPSNANNATWALVFTSNFAVNILYCLYLMRERKSFQNFTKPNTGIYWIGSVLMGLLWAGGIVVYGMGATRVGQFGAYIGFPVMLISSILTGNALGILTGEWKEASKKSKQVMLFGVVLLVLALAVIAYSNQLIT
jgi:L-rhamnose-H+ transport protein